MEERKIDPEAYYRICEAAKLVGCHHHTLLTDYRAGLVKALVSKKGTKKFLGKDLIYYKTFIL